MPEKYKTYISTFRDWLKSQFGNHGEGHVFFPKDTPIVPSALNPVIPWGGNTTQKAALGTVQPIAHVDNLGNLRGEMIDLDQVIYRTQKGPLYLFQILRYAHVGAEAGKIIKAATSTPYYVGRIVQEPDPTSAQATSNQIWIEDGSAVVFPLYRKYWKDPSTDSSPFVSHEIPRPVLVVNRDLKYKCNTEAGKNGYVFVFLYQETRPSDVSLTVVT